MIVLAAIVCALALYGTFSLAKCAAAYFKEAGPEHPPSESLVMFVKNREESVEGMVRSAVWRALSKSGGRTVNDIVVVDLGSEDETFEILMRLQSEYEFLYAMRREQYIEKIQEM